MATAAFRHLWAATFLLIAMSLFSPQLDADGTVEGIPALTAPLLTPLQFDESQNARVEGRLAGKAFHEYTFTARKGQHVALVLLSDVADWIAIKLLSPVFATAPAMRPVVYTNFIDGSTSWQGVAPDSGIYTVRLALLHADAKRASQVEYELDVVLK